MAHVKARIITGSSSIFLDCLRIGAAFTVLYMHAFERWFPSQVHDQNKPGEPSHAAVIVFFVLSGYVIAHTTISKNRGGLQYAQARLTRLSSVVIPALVVTAIVQYTVGRMDPVMLSLYSRGFSGVRYILSGLFINEFWFFSAAPPINISLWSLSFEFWYYTIFGLWFFRKPGWKSIVIVLLGCIIAGPKILLMMPIWLSGYFAYSLPRPLISVAKAWILVFAVLFIAWLAIAYIPPFPYVLGYKPLYYANQFVTDWIVGLLIAVALWILPTANSLAIQTKPTKYFRVIADLTFPLYVLHFPLIILWRCLFGYKDNDSSQLWLAIITVAIVSLLIGLVLEKQRVLWAGFFKWILLHFKTRFIKNNNTLRDTR
jgi:peptidoglycan/LPS O-acetylase OafA/YrhL